MEILVKDIEKMRVKYMSDPQRHIYVKEPNKNRGEIGIVPGLGMMGVKVKKAKAQFAKSRYYKEVEVWVVGKKKPIKINPEDPIDYNKDVDSSYM